MRLQKYMAMCGVASRRHSEEMIAAGRVTVDGVVISEPGFQVEEGQKVCVDGRFLTLQEEKLVFAFYKPQGVVTTMTDPQGRKTVADYFNDLDVRVYPIGRLDYDTEGLLLVTNNGDLAQHVAHPRYVIEKTYLTIIRGHLTAENIHRLTHGVRLEDGITAPASVKILEKERETTRLLITIHEGRNRQVRRMFAAEGFKVQYLKRVRLGPVQLGNMRPGERRLLRDDEIKALTMDGRSTDNR